MAEAIAREQTLEVPEGVASRELESRLLGRIVRIEPAGDRFEATISLAPEISGSSVPQLLNAVAGNVTLMDGVRLVDVSVPDALASAIGGPKHGIAGVRRAARAESARPLVAAALKPVGLDTKALARLAGVFTRAGVDAVKDDHGLWDQPDAPFRERLPRIADAVRDGRARAGTHTLYFPNVTGPSEGLLERAAFAAEAGCDGLMLCPSLVGLDDMRRLAGPDGPGLPIMAHPSHADVGPGRGEGLAPEVLLGTLYRLAGADAVVYVNARGRFAWPVETCEEINERLRRPMGSVRPALPTPAGGVEAAEAAVWLERYGPDTMLLIGGSLLGAADVEVATRALVASAHDAAAGRVAT